MTGKVFRRTVVVLLAAVLAVQVKPASAELGGLLNLDGGPASVPDTVKQPWLELNSFSWERGDWGPDGRESKVRYGRVAVPDKEPGVLAVVMPFATADKP